MSLRKPLYVNRVTFCSVFLNLIISYFNVAFKLIHFKWEEKACVILKITVGLSQSTSPSCYLTPTYVNICGFFFLPMSGVTGVAPPCTSSTKHHQSLNVTDIFAGWEEKVQSNISNHIDILMPVFAAVWSRCKRKKNKKKRIPTIRW